MKAWRYAYDDAGHLVGTSDARGCGQNIFYDGVGRLVGRDYSPCAKSQPEYTAPILANARTVVPTSGDGMEVFHVYDVAEPGQSSDLGVTDAFYPGQIAAVYDRGSYTRFGYDGRGRSTAIEKRIAKPGPAAFKIDDRYATHWYRRATAYDEGNRIARQSTGAENDLLGAGGTSEITFDYSPRGTVAAVGGSYGALVSSTVYDPDGALRSRTLGDLASTTDTYDYDSNRRLFKHKLSRAAAPVLWTSTSSNGSYARPAPGSTTQLDLEDVTVLYDAVDNVKHLADGRTAAEWPLGAKPVTRDMGYDSLYRLSSVAYSYAGGPDVQRSPYQAEIQQSHTSAFVPMQTLPTRVKSQSFKCDWSGNTTFTSDDVPAPMERSLGTITNSNEHPNQLASAGNGISANYDDAGHMVHLLVQRSVQCSDPNGKCTQRFIYDWSEVGELTRARRWDYASISPIDPPYPAVPTARPAVDLRFTYGAGVRVLKTADDGEGTQAHDVDIFASLRLRGTRWNTGANDYDASPETTTLYLAGLARVVADDGTMPAIDRSKPHVLFTLGDHLGSTSVVIDKATGELVERITYQAYGRVESDYRPERWNGFREDHRFTGQYDDAAVGLTYFAARYYNSLLGRWLSADPLTIHAFGGSANPYSYVRGSPLTHTDPLGLCDSSSQSCPDPGDPPGFEIGFGGGGGGSGGGGGGGGGGSHGPGQRDYCRQGTACGPRGFNSITAINPTNVFTYGPGGNGPLSLPWQRSTKVWIDGLVADAVEMIPRWAHTLLSLAGMIPVIGEPVDLLHATIYLTEGNGDDAFWTATSAIPGIVLSPGLLSRVGGRTVVSEMAIVPYNRPIVRTAPTYFEKHHGVLNAWASANFPGYVKGAAPSVVLSEANHAATKEVYRDWLRARTGLPVGAGVDWKTVSPREMYDLTIKMFDAANVPEAVRKEYWEAFAKYIGGL